MDKPKLLFLCTGNSCRSQIAEGYGRHLLGETFDVYSAGIETHGLNPLAVEVMREHGVDISAQYSKTVAELEMEIEHVITVCGHADEHCPVFPASTRILHHPFDDPPRLAVGANTTEEKLLHYRRVRDQIRAFVITLPRLLAIDGW